MSLLMNASQTKTTFVVKESCRKDTRWQLALLTALPYGDFKQQGLEIPSGEKRTQQRECRALEVLLWPLTALCKQRNQTKKIKHLPNLMWPKPQRAAWRNEGPKKIRVYMRIWDPSSALTGGHTCPGQHLPHVLAGGDSRRHASHPWALGKAFEAEVLSCFSVFWPIGFLNLQSWLFYHFQN